MKLAPPIRLPHPSRHCPRARLVPVLLVLLAACGSPSEPASQPGSSPAPSRGTAGEGAGALAALGGGGSTSATPAPATEVPPLPALVPSANGAAGGATGGAAGAPGQPSSVAPLPAGACQELGGDACGACVCERCADELAECASVEGCADILACVQASGCSGRDCYCGSASLTDCLAGEALGPCADVVLRAPGASVPTLEEPSAGPASDASLQVADCAQARGTCRDVCGAGD